MLEEKIISHTQNPYAVLFSVAQRTKINVNELDFTLLSFSTEYRFESKDEWSKLSEKELSLFDEDENFLKEHLQIKQEYKIEIFHDPNKNANEVANAVKLIANKSLTKIVAQINFNALKFHDKLALELLQSIYKKMLKLKFLIGIRIFDFKKELLSFVGKHRANALKKPVQIIVTRGVEPMKPQDEELIFVYKDKAKKYTLDEKRSGIIAVDENELVFRHLKAKKGKEGKDLNLHILKVLEPNENKLKFSCSAAFKVVENENGTDYIALKKGFITENADKYDISNVLEFNRAVDFKSIGVIRAGLDKNIKINIKFISDMQDAVNSGVGIECEELNISGSVAGNTELKATNLRIEGMTNSKSKIYAKNAYIKTHRGYVEGDNIDIDLLENGTVKAKIVKIKKSLGGNIKADKIYIENVTSNNFVVFYENAVVGNLEADNNKFLAQIRTLDEDYDKKISLIKDEMISIDKKIKTTKQRIVSSKNSVVAIEKKVSELKNAKKSIPPQYEKIIREYNFHNQQFNKLQSRKQELLDEENSIHQKLLELQKKLFEATFINKSGKWSNMNEVCFSLIEPKKDLFYSSSNIKEIKFIGLSRDILNNEELIKLDVKLDFDEKDTQWLSQSKE